MPSITITHNFISPKTFVDKVPSTSEEAITMFEAVAEKRPWGQLQRKVFEQASKEKSEKRASRKLYSQGAEYLGRAYLFGLFWNRKVASGELNIDTIISSPHLLSKALMTLPMGETTLLQLAKNDRNHISLLLREYRIPFSAQERILDVEKSISLGPLASRVDLSNNLMYTLADPKFDLATRYAISVQENLSSEALHRLVLDTNPSIRTNCAKKGTLSYEDAVILSSDPETAVRQAIVANSSISDEIRALASLSVL